MEWVPTIRAVLSRFDGVDGVAVDRFSPRKLANARAACRVPEDEMVIAFVDCTVRRSAKHAVVFGTRAVYIHNRWTSECPDGVFVAGYDELARLDELVAYRTPTLLERVRPAARRALTEVRAGIEQARVKHQSAERARMERARVERAHDEAFRASPAVAADDIGASPEARALQEAIAAAPTDEGPQLVLADLLVGADDPRGELIVLHHREMTEGLRDPEALDRYLLLAAVYSFPRAEPEERPLPFVHTHVSPVQYAVTYGGHAYDLHYANGLLVVHVDGRNALQRRLKLESNNAWTPGETAVILRHVGEAIRADAPLQYLQLPYGREPLPTYDGGPVRSYRLPREFTEQRGLGTYELGLAARDYQRWMMLWRRLASVKALAS